MRPIRRGGPIIHIDQSLALPLKMTMPFFLNFLGASAVPSAPAPAGAGLLAEDVAAPGLASGGGPSALLAEDVAAPGLTSPAALSPSPAAALLVTVLVAVNADALEAVLSAVPVAVDADALDAALSAGFLGVRFTPAASAGRRTRPAAGFPRSGARRSCGCGPAPPGAG